jgi:hypothetical protein
MTSFTLTSTQRKILRITGFVGLGLLTLTVAAVGYAYSQRDQLLKTALNRAIKKAKRDYQLNVSIGSARFTGLKSVAFENISVVPEARDSLARIERVEVGVRLGPLLLGQIGLSDMTLQNGLVQVVRRDSLTNVDFILKKRSKRDSVTADTDPKRANLADVAENLIDNLLSKIPDNLDVKNLTFRLIDTKEDTVRRFDLLTESARIDHEAVTSTLRLNGDEAIWHVGGTANPGGREYDLILYAEGQNGRAQPVELQYLKDRYNLKLQADTLGFRLRDVDRDGDEFRLEGSGSVRNLRINHPAIAREDVDVVVPSAAMDAKLFVGENYVGIDSTSTVYLGAVQARPFLKYTIADTSKVYDVGLHTDPLDAQALFNSLPQGLFESLEGIRVQGKLDYDLAMHLDTGQPDSVRFNSSLTPENFRILRFGQVNFASINQPFVYTPYEKGKPGRPIIVGPENPDFTPLDAIAPDLRNAILTSEDYTFFTHKGFNEKAFRVSIATNYKAGSFKRGASTVSMQLVKNVFLNRSKTLSRKIEEILIVWLIENERVVPKERMYEVYLNIIEWGRDVYGIGEASRYYFEKTPAELNLGESIFLAFVIPSPKRALDWFQPDGSLQTRNVRGYFRIIGRIMAKRGLTAPQGESDSSGTYGFYDVRLREGLRKQVPYYPDSLYMESDSLQIDNFEGDEINNVGDFFNRLFRGRRPADARNAEGEPVVVPEEGTGPAAVPTDSVPKTRRQLRQEERDRKRREKEQQKPEEILE